MKDEIKQPHPNTYQAIQEETISSGFTMASEILACALLRTLAASKPGGRLLELGTGTGLSTSWILDGMDAKATLTSIDNDPKVIAIAEKHLGNDHRLSLITTDGEAWVHANRHQKYDYIFADTWHGKYLLLDEVLTMLNKGGLYIIDDMLPQSNWPDGHQQKAENLLSYLDNREDLVLTRQAWASGLVIAVKK